MRDSTVNKRELKLNGDGNKKGRKATGLTSKTSTLHMHQAWVFISLLLLHDYEIIKLEAADTSDYVDGKGVSCKEAVVLHSWEIVM